MSQPNDFRFLSLFSGAGGLDHGLEASGWQLLAQVEMDPDAIGTLELAGRRREKAELPEAALYGSRIEDVSPLRIRRELGLRRGELPLMAGGPPCQPFTTHGLRRSITDGRASGIWPTYLEYVDEFLPKSLLLENVDGLLSAALQHRRLLDRGPESPPLIPEERKASFLYWLVCQLTAKGYTVTWGLVEAADYGVPQLRQRSILIGVRGKDPCFLPDPQFGPYGDRPYRTLREVLPNVGELGSIQPLSERKAAVYEKIPPGGNWRDLTVEVQKQTMGAAHAATGGKSGWWRRLAWDAPAPTILGMPDHSSTALVHPDEVRCLSVRECAALQSFPAETEFAGSGRSQYQQIGNAVPPLLGSALGTHLQGFHRGLRGERPGPPPWRKSSANRRIGTHGWVVVKSKSNLDVNLNVKIRVDHIWTDLKEGTLELGAT